MKYSFLNIIVGVLITFVMASCAEKEKVDLTQAPDDVKDAVEHSYILSEKLTDLQVKAGADNILNEKEIEEIGESFRELAIVNNINLKNYATDKYFIALRKEYKPQFDTLAAKVVFLKDCEGYDDMGLAIQKISIEVKDVIELPVPEPEVTDTTAVPEPM